MCTKAPSFASGATRATVPAILLICVLTGVASAETATVGASPDSGEPRSSRSSQYPEGGRSASPAENVTDDRYGALVTTGGRSAPDGGQGKLAGAAGTSEASSENFWIYYADVQLFADDDRDGYYHGIDLLFDADTVFEQADVYAVLYLSYEGGPWNEYAVTDTFRIFGATSDDEYVVVTDLESGYPRGNYDLLLDLYDTYDGRLVATLGPEGTSAFAYLPLEDINRDDPRGGDTVVIVDRGGGALDGSSVAGMLMYLLAVWLVRRRQRQSA